MNATIRFLAQLAVLGVICSGTQQASAVNAIWSEEMAAAPGPAWTAWDDANGNLADDILTVADPEDGSNSVWQIPMGVGTTRRGPGGLDFGMAYVPALQPGIGNPANQWPVTPMDGISQYTVEFRYRINTDTEYPISGAGITETFPIAVSIGKSRSPALRYSEGFNANRTGTLYNYLQTATGEGGLWGGAPGTAYVPPAGGGVNYGTTREQWHTVRVVQDDIGWTQKTYLDGVLITEHDTSAYFNGVGGPFGPGPVDFTRSIAIWQGQQFTPGGQLDLWTYSDVMYDYIRVANGLIPINEPIAAAIPEPASGLMAMLALCALGLVARR